MEEPCANIVFGKNYMFVIAKRFIVASNGLKNLIEFVFLFLFVWTCLWTRKKGEFFLKFVLFFVHKFWKNLWRIFKQNGNFNPTKKAWPNFTLWIQSFLNKNIHFQLFFSFFLKLFSPVLYHHKNNFVHYNKPVYSNIL